MPSPTSARASVPQRGHRKLTNAERGTIYETLLAHSVDGTLPHGCITRTAQTFDCTWKTISSVWTRVRLSLRDGSLKADVTTKYSGNINRKMLRTDDEIERAFKAVPMHARQTMRTLAAQSGIPKTTIFRHMQRAKTLKSKTSHSKPYLTDANTVQRMRHAASFLRPSPNGTLFDNMHSQVHDELPKRQLKSKLFITKVIFLAAVARPRNDHNKKCVFDGKLGVWTFMETALAKLNSRNRLKVPT
ncbi:hypothetical protein H257_15296 [Aphanomyces astaci]|uniref:DUF7769 domain-containing protein n=1 Tax=Aphanomyces astaci TaxID=112090 RepID=W4FNB8_APHAT|nr:hypothetical protein H257_15296 [Aphanomyces astaci]ETV68960.1 hypothetical protein H257_15296 [Aphanomyces astaci]|eukprot:XP_009841637.1 hypothetical protein H257_15296 [Aphanomyces astaci]